MASKNTHKPANSNMVDISATMTEDVAEQFAQFCKRSSFDIFYALTEEHLTSEERKHRAYLMISGIESIQAALAKAGFSPR